LHNKVTSGAYSTLATAFVALPMGALSYAEVSVGNGKGKANPAHHRQIWPVIAHKGDFVQGIVVLLQNFLQCIPFIFPALYQNFNAQIAGAFGNQLAGASGNNAYLDSGFL